MASTVDSIQILKSGSESSSSETHHCTKGPRCNAPEVRTLSRKARIKRKVKQIKIQHRTDITAAQWTVKSYHKICDLPGGSCYTQNLKTDARIQRLQKKDLSVSDFTRQHRNPGIPVILQDIVTTWPAYGKWDFDYFETGPYRNCKLSCGETDDGYALKLKLKHIISYMKNQTDDSPLYVFDDQFECSAPDMQGQYSIPEYFTNDVMAGVDRRPPHKWLLVGPKRSGSFVHVDPFETGN